VPRPTPTLVTPVRPLSLVTFYGVRVRDRKSQRKGNEGVERGGLEKKEGKRHGKLLTANERKRKGDKTKEKSEEEGSCALYGLHDSNLKKSAPIIRK